MLTLWNSANEFTTVQKHCQGDFLHSSGEILRCSSLEAAENNGKYYQGCALYQVMLHTPPPPLFNVAAKNRHRLRAFHVVCGLGLARGGWLETDEELDDI